ncbi:MAG: membrane protein insertase YidC [Thermodesulfobacteriota bacterium]
MEMNNDKRIMLALALSLAVFLGYSIIADRYAPKMPLQKTEKKEVEPAAADISEKSVTETKPSGIVKKPIDKQADFKEEIVTVETPLFKAEFTSLGAGIKKWEFKKYGETMDKNSLPVDIAKNQKILSHVQTKLSINGEEFVIPFKSSVKTVRLEKGETGAIVFSWTSAQGVTIEKTYTFKGDDYMADFSVKVLNNSKTEFRGSVESSMARVFTDKDQYYHKGPIRSVGNKTKRQDMKTRKESGEKESSWVGIEDKYFLSAFLPAKGSSYFWNSEVASRSEPAKYLLFWTKNVSYVSESVVTFGLPFALKPEESGAFDYKLYIGPKEYDRLISYGLGIEEAIEFGMFAFAAKPSLVVLNFFERFVKNYGIAIIILTILLKFAFYPLTKYGLKSMKQIQQIQPQILSLKEKYKDDKQRMNKEVFELYKRYKVNPLSGCLPMIVQIPVFIALYEVLLVAIELRHSPFAFWLQDLSAQDPYYITPVFMGITMFIQQKMTPTAMDPAQEKIMLIMPVVLTFLFFTFPSGLIIYWIVNNLISIAQQYQIYREMPKTS